MWMKFLIFSLALFAATCLAKKKGHVGLIASTGTHSHDLLMYQLAEKLSAMDYEITWIQYRVFDFNRTKPIMNPEWRKITQDCVTWETADFVKSSQEQIWITTIPFDIERWDFRAILALKDIYLWHSDCCAQALQNQQFWDQLMEQRFDLVILDYILLECSTALSAHLDAPVIHISNFPLSNSYSEFMGVPSNPSYVPSVLSPLPSSLSFIERVINSLLFFFACLSRRIEIVVTQLSFWRAGRMFKEPFAVTDARTLNIATVAEFMLESARPQTHHMKYFGVPYAISDVKPLNISQAMNISTISPNGVIVVSFGSMTSGEHIPVENIQTFMSVFGNLTYTVIWQFGSDHNTKGVSVPENVHLFNWVPLHELLASKEVKLMVGHGGIRSMLEAIHQGLPLVGIPIQGPQFHDLQRVVEKGAAEMISIPELTETALGGKINKILDHYDSYKRNAELLSSIIKEYYGDLLQGTQPSEFWLQWAVKHGRQMVESRRFYRYTYSNFFVYFCLDVIFVFGLFFSAVFYCCYKLICATCQKCLVEYGNKGAG